MRRIAIATISAGLGIAGLGIGAASTAGAVTAVQTHTHKAVLTDDTMTLADIAAACEANPVVAQFFAWNVAAYNEGQPYFTADGLYDPSTGVLTPLQDFEAVSQPVVSPAPPQQTPPPPPAGSTNVTGVLACIEQAESGGNPTAVNASSGAGGLFQFLPSTWASLGYSGLPQNAPVSEQIQAAETLYAQQGIAPWSGDGC